MEICKKEFAKRLHRLAENLGEYDISLIDSENDNDVYDIEQPIGKLCQAVLNEIIAVETISGDKFLTIKTDNPAFIGGVRRKIPLANVD